MAPWSVDRRHGDDATPAWVDDPSLDFATVLRRAIERRGLTLARAHARMAETGDAVSVATLSHWQSGRSLPGRRISRGVLQTLERVLDLPEDTLRAALERTQKARRDRPDGAVEVVQRLPLGERVLETFASTGLPFVDHLTRVSVLERLWLGPNGGPVRQQLVQTLRAEEDGCDSFTAFQLDFAERPSVGTFAAGVGCELRRVETASDGRLTIGVFRLFEPLAKGEVVTTSYSVTFPEPERATTSHGRIHRTAFRDSVLEVVFHPDRLPARVEHFYEPADSPYLGDPDVLDLASTFGQRPVIDGTAQSYFANREPGLSGMRWEWPGPETEG